MRQWWLFSDGHASSSLEDEILVYASSWTSCLFPCLCPHEVLIGSATPPPSSSRRVFPFILHGGLGDPRSERVCAWVLSQVEL
ncbi:hypothetical protein HID58_028555 [Brassica napus]|uniref:Uncharacterized protein n=1 Tax=Brassica napus TaxID=3708 RepID=A0ABQ8CAK0_BRANA|nr:hypothetical protein HID58_028555 [Brassica napus]